MKPWFLKRGYPNYVIEKDMKKVELSKISSNRKDNAQGVPLVVAYHPGLEISTKLSTKIYTFFLWIEKLRKYLQQSFFP